MILLAFHFIGVNNMLPFCKKVVNKSKLSIERSNKFGHNRDYM